MEKQHDIIMNLDDLFFQCQMLSGVAFLLWDSLAKPMKTTPEDLRSIYYTIRWKNFYLLFVFRLTGWQNSQPWKNNSYNLKKPAVFTTGFQSFSAFFQLLSLSLSRSLFSVITTLR